MASKACYLHTTREGGREGRREEGREREREKGERQLGSRVLDRLEVSMHAQSLYIRTRAAQCPTFSAITSLRLLGFLQTTEHSE